MIKDNLCGSYIDINVEVGKYLSVTVVTYLNFSSIGSQTNISNRTAPIRVHRYKEIKKKEITKKKKKPKRNTVTYTLNGCYGTTSLISNLQDNGRLSKSIICGRMWVKFK